MDYIKNLNEWLMQKFQKCSTIKPYISIREHEGTSKIITPVNIPKFVIPRSEKYSERTSYISVDDNTSNISTWKRLGRVSLNSTPAATATESLIPMNSREEDLAVTSALPSSQSKCEDNIACMDDCDDRDQFTNEDPQSIVAMSLKHLRTKTSFGFTTLSESPKTLRKESLFHSSGGSLQQRLGKEKKQTSLSQSEDNITIQSFTGRRDDIESPLLQNVSNLRTITMTDESQEFAQDSIFRSSTVPGELLLCYRKSNPLKRHRVYNRQRSSLADQVSLAENEIKSTEEKSPFRSRSANIQCSGKLLDPGIRGKTNNSNSALTIFARVSKSSSLDTLDKMLSKSCCTIQKASQVDNLYAPHGEIKFSFQYLPASKQFKVCLIRAENLGSQNKTDMGMNSFATLYLLPAKLQKQRGIVVKRTKNPNFNQAFYFQQLTLDELHSMVLRIKLFNKCHNLKLAEFIGEVSIPLDRYDLSQENRMWKDLETKEDRQDSGLLEFAIQFLPRQDLLKVTIHQARSLPYHHLTGAPNPYVKVELSQPGTSLSTKQTKTKRKTSYPVYAESFLFTLSPKMDNLRLTALTISVIDYKKLLNDVTIGQISLGSTSTEENLSQLWDDVITNPEKTFTKWHYLTEVE